MTTLLKALSPLLLTTCRASTCDVAHLVHLQTGVWVFGALVCWLSAQRCSTTVHAQMVADGLQDRLYPRVWCTFRGLAMWLAWSKPMHIWSFSAIAANRRVMWSAIHCRISVVGTWFRNLILCAVYTVRLRH